MRKLLILLMIASSPAHFKSDTIKRNVGENWLLKMSNLKALNRGLQDLYMDMAKPWDAGVFDVSKIAYVPDIVEIDIISRDNSAEDIMKLVEVVMECAICSEQKEAQVKILMGMSPEIQAQLMPILSGILTRMQADEVVDASPQMSPSAAYG